MRWIYRNRIVGFGAYPAVENTAARKYQRVYAVVVDDGHFQIAIKRGGGHGLPIHTGTMGFGQAKRFDLDQFFIPRMPPPAARPPWPDFLPKAIITFVIVVKGVS